MNLISAIVHVHYGDCSKKVQIQGTIVVAGAAETEYTGERALFLESTVGGHQTPPMTDHNLVLE